MTKKELLQKIEALTTILEQDPETNIKNLEKDNIHIEKNYYYPMMYGYIESSLKCILWKEERR